MIFSDPHHIVANRCGDLGQKLGLHDPQLRRPAVDSTNHSSTPRRLAQSGVHVRRSGGRPPQLAEAPCTLGDPPTSRVSLPAHGRAPSGCGSRMSDPGPDQLRLRPATPTRRNGSDPPSTGVLSARANMARKPSRVRLTKSNPGDFIDHFTAILVGPVNRTRHGRTTDIDPVSSARIDVRRLASQPAEYPRAPRQSPTPVRRTRPPSPTLDGAARPVQTRRPEQQHRLTTINA